MVEKNYITFINRLNQAKASRVKSIDVKLSKDVLNIIKKLLSIGIITSYKLLSKNNNMCRVFLKYRGGYSLFLSIKVINKPGLKVTTSLNRLLKIKEASFNTHILLLSTQKGILTDLECFQHNIGGVPVVAIELY